MDEILTFLVCHCSFLYKDYGFRFVDSEVTKHFGGDAYVIMASGDLRLSFISDRGQLFLDFQCVAPLKKGQVDKSWYSIDLVRQLITAEEGYRSILDEENAKFLRTHFPAIQELFNSKNFAKVRDRLLELKRVRSKTLFR